LSARSQYQNHLDSEIEEDQRSQSTLELEIAKPKQDLEATTQAPARFDSQKLTKQIIRMSEMHGQISDLEDVTFFGPRHEFFLSRIAR